MTIVLFNGKFQIEEGPVGDLLVLGGDKDGRPIDIGATVDVEMRDALGPGGTRVQRPVWKRGGEPRCFVLSAPGANRERLLSGPRARSYDRFPWREGSRHARSGMDARRDHRGWRHAHATVNGIVVLEATAVTPTSARLQFQTEQAEIYFRRIEMLPLKK